MDKPNFGNKIIFATGVYLVPALCADGKYRWTVSTFDDDSFYDGDVFNPAFIACDNLSDLENISDEMDNPDVYEKQENY